MAFGRHWEWRGFGRLSQELEARLRALPKQFSRPQVVLDRYLWYPGIPWNLKLRFGAFKVKRRLGGADGVEEWLEDPSENFEFPWTHEVTQRVLACFGLDPSLAPQGPLIDEAECLALLRQQIPGLRELGVKKRRWTYLGPATHPVSVEIAEITTPEVVSSVALEDGRRDRLLAARDELGLPSGLTTLSYLEALERWGRGETIGALESDLGRSP